MSDRAKSDTAKREEDVLAYWKEQGVFERSVEKRAPRGEFVFYDGPPFATGLPHYGSLLSSVVKDVVGRYKTMRGYRVPRQWGWDCHGLPIETEVEKKLGLKTKKDIVSLGVDTFNETARSMVLRFVDEWEKYVDRIGRWVDFKNSYKTMDNSYIETVWWALKELNDKKLLYEGRKVLMYCPHCETPLAKAEIAMDNTYKDVTEEAVTVKFRLKNPQKYGLPENTHVLAWTTTPWTLPGNVALAVGASISYLLVEKDGEYLVVAKDRYFDIGGTVAGELPGSQLVGAEYEPLYRVNAVEAYKGKKHVILAADFVTTTEGTGVVHTAVMYGEDDFALGQKEGLPMVQLLSSNGTYNDLAPEFIHGEYIKKAERLIKDDLEGKGLVFSREKHTHSYPHCYRCGTALIYNAVASWFINIQKVKKTLLSENEKINWVPAHLKEGRFKHIVENAPDWTISRNRFWASPLPIWKEKGGAGLMVVGSVAELLERTKRSGNTYFAMRHGEARGNLENRIDSNNDPQNHLTEKGREEALTSAQKLAREGIDLIVCSPSVRTRETATIVQKALGLPESALMVDERLREVQTGDFNGKNWKEWEDLYDSYAERFKKAPPGGETFLDIKKRTGELLFEVERRYTNKKVLFVTHNACIWLMHTTAQRYPVIDKRLVPGDDGYLQTGEVKELPFVPFPHNANYEMDLHRPYIDHMVLVDNKGRQYERIPEVIDCWVESGAMPYASNHYPFENKHAFNPGRLFGFMPKGFPADFIAEYIAQTRTWFYYMHAMGVLLFGKQSFKNVVSTGTILAADSTKMSKSKGNFTDPLNIMDQFGADALRMYLMGSVVMSGEDLSFKDEDVREIHNRVIGIFWNSYKFYELYKHEYAHAHKAQESGHVLDQWMLSLLNKTVKEVTEALDAYDTPRACRALRACVDSYSTWYVRRSRDRVKSEANPSTELEASKQWALATQRTVLLTLTKLFAPIMPYIAESVYRMITEETDSVHLCEWPEAGEVNEELLVAMERARAAASAGLQERELAGIKIRQPLQRLVVRTMPQDLRLRDVIAAEVNVKEVAEDTALPGEVWLDATITPELAEEGMVRTLVRRVQEWRKEEKLSIADRPTYTLVVSEEEKPVAQKYRAQIAKEAGLHELKISVE